MHVWKGKGGCGFFDDTPAVMEIHADDVTVKNFGFKGAVHGISIVDEGLVRKNIRLENVEGISCFRAFSLPNNFSGLWLKDVSTVVWSEDGSQ